MKKYNYLASDGGPHIVLPTDVMGDWKGVDGAHSDYANACAATRSADFAMIPVGIGHAIVLQDPPMTACGRGDTGEVDVYLLHDWDSMKLDDLIDRAIAGTPTAVMTDSGHRLTLTTPDLKLLFAGDTTRAFAYGVHTVECDPGTYRLLAGTFRDSGRGHVTIYRLVPHAHPAEDSIDE